MKSVNKYEAAGVLWWFSFMQEVSFQGQPVFKATVKHAAVEEAMVIWSEAAFMASDLVPSMRHFCFPGHYPTACSGLPDAQKTITSKVDGLAAPTFHQLPLVAGHAVVLAYLRSLFEAMEADNGERLVMLFQAMGGGHLAN